MIGIGWWDWMMRWLNGVKDEWEILDDENGGMVGWMRRIGDAKASTV